MATTTTLIKTVIRNNPTLVDKLGSFVFGNAVIKPYDENTEYKTDDFIFEISNDGSIIFYQCLEPTTGPFDVSKWNAVSLIDLIGSGDIISDAKPLGRTVSTWLKPVERSFHDVDAIPVEMNHNMLEYEINDDVITITKVISIEDKPHFYGSVIIPEYIMDNPVSYVGDNGFVGMLGATDLIIPDTILSIGSGAFRVNVYDSDDERLYLTSVSIGYGITAIPYRAFYNQSRITSLDIPGTVESIDEEAFANCTSLTDVTIHGKYTSIHENTFSGSTSLTTIHGYKNSTAEDFAISKSLTFVEL